MVSGHAAGRRGAEAGIGTTAAAPASALATVRGASRRRLVRDPPAPDLADAPIRMPPPPEARRRQPPSSIGAALHRQRAADRPVGRLDRLRATFRRGLQSTRRPTLMRGRRRLRMQYAKLHNARPAPLASSPSMETARQTRHRIEARLPRRRSPERRIRTALSAGVRDPSERARLRGFEALLAPRRTRMAQPIPPTEFIPVAEAMGLIDDAPGLWALREACRTWLG